MKASYYNNYIVLEDGDYALFNRLSGALLIIDEETKVILENMKEREAELPEELINMFIQNGVIIENTINEFSKIKYRYNMARYNPKNLSFVLAPTARCNLSCFYCVQRVDDSPVDKGTLATTMSESTIENILHFMKKMVNDCEVRTLPIAYFGGEPMMAKEVIFRIQEDLTQWCEEHSIKKKILYYSNLTLFDQTLLDKLLKYGTFEIRTTLDGPKKIHDQYRHYRNGEGTFEHILTNIQMLLDAGINVRVQYNINRHYAHAPELMDELIERGLTHIAIEPYPLFDPVTFAVQAQELHGLSGGSASIPESKFAVHFKDIFKARTYMLRAAYDKGFKFPSPGLYAGNPCDGTQMYHYALGPSGDVFKCTGSILIPNFRVGHIHENGYFEQYPFFYEWMDKATDVSMEKCQSCRFLPSCGGGCMVGRYLSGLPFFCEISFSYGEEHMKMCLKQQYPELLKSLKIE